MRTTIEQVERLVRELVDHPDEVEVRGSKRGDQVELEVEVAPDDVGAVIGREGRTARAIRYLLEARSASTGLDYDLRILD